MLEALENALFHDCELSPGSVLLVGVSGGADSLSLLHALLQIGVVVIAAHFNHRLRADADEDADFVANFSKELGVSCVIGEGDTKAHAEEQHMSIEEAARELRYQFLFQEAEKSSADAVVVAHTADDQVETVLMHLLRGAGLDGLRGMQMRSLTPWHPKIHLVRPMLKLWKKDILAYCELHSLTPRFDRSNLDTTFFRNRIRHELLPVLESFNPNIRKLLFQTSDLLAHDQKFLEEIVEDVWQGLVLEKTQQHVAFQRGSFVEMQTGLKRRILRKAVAELRPGLRDVGFSAIEWGVDWIDQPGSNARADFLADLFMRVEDDRVIIGEWGHDLPHPDFPQILSDSQVDKFSKIPAKVGIGFGWYLLAETIPMKEISRQEIMKNSDPYIGYFDFSNISLPLRIRIRQAGDRFKPLGMDGVEVNLADFMINERIPARARDFLPLLCMGEEIVWVPGFRIGHPFRIVEDTDMVLKIQFVREEKSL